MSAQSVQTSGDSKFICEERNIEIGRIEGPGNVELTSDEGSLYCEVTGGASVSAPTDEGRVEVCSICTWSDSFPLQCTLSDNYGSIRLSSDERDVTVVTSHQLKADITLLQPLSAFSYPAQFLEFDC